MLDRIYVDFNTMGQDLWSKEPRVRIPRVAARPLTDDGLRVIIFDDELEVEARLEFDPERKVWWARPDWSTRRDLSEAGASGSQRLSA